MKPLAERIGLYRVAALLVACALVLEILRVEVLAGSAPAQVACTFGEVVFLALAAMVFLSARRRGSRES
ncbi:hypothetical protein [Gaiella sp.]|uniref:hypothetical protein n=1 Tax=Gaiella sp. TaxID=2663207 RepID=UPI003983DA95